MMHNHMDRMNSVLSADNVAVVTGAVRGIGRALVHVLEARGMRVIAVDIDQEQLATLGAGEARVLDVA
ncbi:MAG: SDR family NAD(P)-dependent oxidoreductase, partial [Pseudomonadota bacterium]